jgi:hypothetical protein
MSRTKISIALIAGGVVLTMVFLVLLSWAVYGGNEIEYDYQLIMWQNIAASQY